MILCLAVTTIVALNVFMLLLLLWFSLRLFPASCRANQTAMDSCGDKNTCFGSSSSYICVCEEPGWTLNPNDYKECIEGTIWIFILRFLLHFDTVSLLLSEIAWYSKYLTFITSVYLEPCQTSIMELFLQN